MAHSRLKKGEIEFKHVLLLNSIEFKHVLLLNSIDDKF